MQEINRTEIATLGEFGLIKHLTKDIELKNPETQYGVGDDAAVLEFKDKEARLRLVRGGCVFLFAAAYTALGMSSSNTMPRPNQLIQFIGEFLFYGLKQAHHHLYTHIIQRRHQELRYNRLS